MDRATLDGNIPASCNEDCYDSSSKRFIDVGHHGRVKGLNRNRRAGTKDFSNATKPDAKTDDTTLEASARRQGIPTLNKYEKCISVTGLGCLSALGCRSKIIRKIAFHPPDPAGYIVREIDENYELSVMIWSGYIEVPMIISPQCDVFFTYLKTSKKSHIACYLINKKSTHLETTPCIIYSNGNSCDIGYCFHEHYRMCERLKVNMIAYDYTGYGWSETLPSESHIYADIRAAYKYALSLNIPPSKIILYGKSLGTAPTCDLMSDPKVEVSGAIIHSAMMSGLRVFVGNMKQSTVYDCFRNIDKIKNSRCPVMMIHGQSDVEIPILHSQMLYKAAIGRLGGKGNGGMCSKSKPKTIQSIVDINKDKVEDIWNEHDDVIEGWRNYACSWWPASCGHNDIEEKTKEFFYVRLDQYITTIMKFNS